MEALPPSYVAATSREHWALVAPYLSPQDLVASSLVCRKWHAVFSKQLWGDPASHYISEPIEERFRDDRLSPGTKIVIREGLVAPKFDVAAFRRCCKLAREAVRNSTHTLRLPAHAQASGTSLYSTTSSGLAPTWLCELVARLPKLQALIARNVREVDHDCLSAFARAKESGIDRFARLSLSPHLSERLKLLDLQNCHNATSKGLAALLGAAAGLVYLDVSGTRAAREDLPLRTLSTLNSLKVLRMNQVGNLTDEKLTLLAHAIGHRVMWLEVEGCGISDQGVRLLRDRCIGDGRINHETPPPYHDALRQGVRRSPDPSRLAKDAFQSLTSGSVSRLAIEDLSEHGVTHLRVGSNNFSFVAAISLLNSGEFTFLDLGSRLPCPRNGDTSLPRPSSGLKDLTRLRVPAEFFFSSLSHFAEGRLVSVGEAGGASLAPMPLPRYLRHTKILVLTGVPTLASTQRVPVQIINLIRSCARAARNQSSLQWRDLFCLRTIILEVTSIESIQAVSRPHKPRTRSSRGWNYSQDVRTVTGDADSEALWRHAEGEDFSFFDETHDQGDEAIEPPATVQIDVVGEIARFRQLAKKKEEVRRKGGGVLYNSLPTGFGFNISAEDFWPGEVKVIRV